MRSKILSIILSVCMVLTLMPTVAFAYSDGDSIEISDVTTSPSAIGVMATTDTAISTVSTTVPAIVLNGKIDDPGTTGVEVTINATYKVKNGESLGSETTTSGAVIIKSTGSEGQKTLEVTDKVTGKADRITFGQGNDAFVAGMKSTDLAIKETTEPPETNTYTVSGTVSRDSYVNTEVALSGISVKLYSVADGVETLFKTVTTGTNGAYQFTEIPNGSYIAKIDAKQGSYREVQRSITVKDGNVTNANIVLLAPSDKSYNINLTVEDETRGNVEIGGATDNKATSGTAITVTATPNQGYELASITVINDKNGTVTVSSSSPCNFTMPASDVNITVVFREEEVPEYSIGKSATTGGTVTTDPGTKAKPGQNVTVTATPELGNKVVSVTVTNLATSSVLVLSNNGDGTYTFTMPTANVEVVAVFTEEDVEVQAGKTEAEVDSKADLTGANLTLATNVADTARNTVATGLDKVLSDSLQKDDFKVKDEENKPVSAEAAQKALVDAGIPVGDDDTVLTVVEPYLDIKVTDADAETNTVTLDINAMYNIKATTAAKAADMNENNSTTVKEGQKLDTGNTKIEIAVPLPSAIMDVLNASDNAKKSFFAKHSKNNVVIGYHLLTKTSNGVKFINDKGFSDFELPVEGKSVTVTFDNGVEETTFTNKNVGEKLPELTLSGYTFNGWKFYTDSAKTNAILEANSYKDLTSDLFDALNAALTGDVTKIYAFADTTYNGGSSSGGGGGGGGSSATTYTVTVPSSIDHGKVTVSPRNASKGNTVTITATPDEGYKVGTITVKDKDGKEIEVKDAGDGKYTFVMPASKVEISATFVEDDGKEPTDPTDPTEPTTVTYSDVAATAWYYDAVNYVTTNGLMNGVGNDRFAPNSNLTRAMFAQILYNKEGKPAAGASTFSDVAAGQWYTDAISWAAANGVVNGIGNNMFGPNNNITREQLAVMLYRYAGSPAVTGSVTGFNDASQISSYATTAMAWATTNGVMNGKGDGRLDPKGLATRAEVAQMMQNYFK